jgi:hypothetical protein
MAAMFADSNCIIPLSGHAGRRFRESAIGRVRRAADTELPILRGTELSAALAGGQVYGHVMLCRTRRPVHEGPSGIWLHRCHYLLIRRDAPGPGISRRVTLAAPGSSAGNMRW